MKLSRTTMLALLVPLAFAAVTASAQVDAPLPGRSINKLAADYLRPRVYALNQASGSTPGTLLALNPTNGAILGEITLNLNPTDMAMTPGGDFLYVINAGSRTISKVDLSTFALAQERSFATPNTYNPDNPLYITAGQAGIIYYTDGAWGPGIYAMNFNTGVATFVLNTGGNQATGAGGLALNRSGNTLFTWQQYGWSAGLGNSSIATFAATPTSLTPGTTGPSQSRDPLDTPIFLDAAERWVFNKVQMVSATNVSVLVNQFPDNIYAIAMDGSVAFGRTQVFNTRNGLTITNLPFATTVQTLSGDQTKLFRYNSATASVAIYDMAAIAAVSGPNPAPAPPDGAVVSLPLNQLSWTVSPTALAYDVYFGTNQAQVSAATAASSQFLGRVTTPPQSLSKTLLPGSTYYWRVDTVGFNATNTGSIWSFTVAAMSVNPAQIVASSIAGYNPANLMLNLTSAAPQNWTAAVTGSNWLSLNATSGRSPTNLIVSFFTAGLPPGQYSNSIEFTAGGLKLPVPVTLNVKPLNITKIAADRQRPYLYALQPPSLSGQNGLLLFINSTNGNIDKTLPIGLNPTDLSINYAEGRLYIASWTETWTYVVDLNTQSLLPPLNVGTDAYRINAGRAGRVITEGEDQWINATLFNTTSGATIGTASFREGDGEFDPAGRYYYHGDNNISGAGITKYDTSGDTFASVVGAGGHYYYGSRNIVMSQDGSRLFWTSGIYDANLADLGVLGGEIYSCSTNGAVAFSASQAYDTSTRQAIYNLPTSSSISAVDGQNKRFWYFNSGNATLGSVPLSVIQSPSITQQPAANTSVREGGSVYLTTTAMGFAPLSYQWTLFGTNLPGQTNYFLSMPSIQLAQQGDYNAVVSNPFGTVTSAVARVTVVVPPGILSQTPSTNVLAGQTLSLSVTGSGTAPFTYRWIFENGNISGGTNQTLVINNAQPVNEGIYRAVIGNTAGSITSAPISVRVLPSAPLIVGQPQSLTIPASSNATFGVTAIGSQPLTYRWYFRGALLQGAAASQFTLAGAQASNNGEYQVIVANSLGAVTSTVALLTVTPMAPYFTMQPVSAAIGAGTNRTLTGIANGSQPIAYQWQHNGTNVPGATQTSLALMNVTISDGGPYMLVASNAVGVSTSAVAQITVYQTPTVARGLSNIVTDIGNAVTLTVDVVGTPILAYSWQWNGQPIPGSSSTLVLSNIQPAQSGFYRVTVTNQFGSVSSTGRVSVLGAPSQVAAWGDNSGGQTNAPAGLNDIVAVTGGDYHSVALHHDGTLIGWGYNGDNQISVPTNELRFVWLASGAAHCLAISERGSVTAWGRNDAGQCNVPPAANNNTLAVAAGDAHSVALMSSGAVLAWGDSSFGQTSVPQGLSGVRGIAAGRNHSLALRSNGTVVGWGFNAYGQASAPALSGATAIAAGYLHSAALLSNGTVVAWGDNTFGQTNVPAGLTNVVMIAAGDFHTIALRRDGTIIGWGDDEYGQTDAPGALAGVSAIATGNYHSLALTPAVAMLQQTLVNSELVIRWNTAGTLQSAPTPLGPYTDVSSPGNCYTNRDMSGPARFFRVRR